MPRKSTEFVQFKLRIREGLRREIEKAAKKKGISANAEAVERLEKSLVAENQFGLLEQFFAQLVERGFLKEVSTPEGQQASAASNSVEPEMINDEDNSVHSSPNPSCR
ncbi:MAG TPA: Arc family DNA-binding protein [Bradyrhizobium sp.]|jgi:hypothetical protein|uniref:Arc family DNA-binding protein n=1 Tax=Bradyrhizobium sp. TaxID=376 RepID=UPI002BCC6F93|nr:Arc family DNA-binding protein [Bradyrhizobium sp.]HXB76727.1 Arc family DNA-binding protein [Bradyrhizobium sp.]